MTRINDLMEDCIYSSWIEDIEDEAIICRLQLAACEGASQINWRPLNQMVTLLLNLHNHMFMGVDNIEPWKLRSKQVYVGWHVPPAPEHLALNLHEFQNRIDEGMSVGECHHLFESIHPFMDGNGRIGRLMMPLLHILRKEEPVFYSKYIREHRDEYYKAFGSKKEMEKFLEGAKWVEKEAGELK